MPAPAAPRRSPARCTASLAAADPPSAACALPGGSRGRLGHNDEEDRLVRTLLAEEVFEGVRWTVDELAADHLSLGDYAKAIAYHTQHLAIAKEVGDRAGEGRAYGNLGNAFGSHGTLTIVLSIVLST